MGKIYIGLDPGKDGYVCIKANGAYFFESMSQYKILTGKKLKSGKPQVKKGFSPEGLIKTAFDIKKMFNQTIGKDHTVVCGIEQVTGRHGWSAENNFNFGAVFGMQYLFAVLLEAKIEKIRPQKWQSFMYQGFDKVMIPSSTGRTMVHDTKATSKKVAQILAPQIDFRNTEKSKNLHDGKTDAFLICRYVEQKF